MKKKSVECGQVTATVLMLFLINAAMVYSYVCFFDIFFSFLTSLSPC